jgi:fatty acid synthase subunit beta
LQHFCPVWRETARCVCANHCIRRISYPFLPSSRFIPQASQPIHRKIVTMENDIHVSAVGQTKTEDVEREQINTHSTSHTTSQSNQSALLNAQAEGRARLYGIFGGQGNNKNYFDELRTVYTTYQPQVHTLIKSLSALLLSLSKHDQVSELYRRGLDVLPWLEDPESTPSAEYLITAPISFPLIGLLQLAQLKAVCVELGCTPADFPTLFGGLTGHSQGVVAAAIASTATTWAEFDDAAHKAVTILFWIGSRCQQIYVETPLPEDRVQQLEDEGYGQATPMLSISNMSLEDLERRISNLNAFHTPGNRAAISLVNSSTRFVVSGPKRTLSALIDILKAASAKDAQARVPFSQRKPNPTIRFLPVTIPCHCSLLDNAVAVIEEDVKAIHVSPSSLRLLVNRTQDGRDLSSRETDNIVPVLIRMITSELVDWTQASFPSATHILDFGPGGISGIGALTQRTLAGTGVRIIIAGTLDLPSASDFGAITEMFNQDESLIQRGADWTIHAPSLAHTAAGTVVDTKLSRLLGLPPVFVAGMTPTTTHPSFVAAVMNAGFHIEFAAGGYHSAESLRAALYKLRELMPVGRGITINVIYIDPRAIAWQIPLIRALRDEGFPIMGLTVGGGVPSVEVATEYITTLGLEHISFKPGSTAAIHQVLEIAHQNPTFPIILQWTGGRGGGHHSFEDFHAPMLETYAEIRKHANLVLAAGSGFGCSEDVRTYLDGTWSVLPPFSRRTRMPFDGILLGSRVMTCLEARTSTGAKAAIAAAPGIPSADEKAWEKTYAGPSGGIVTVISEMGEPIHVVATRGAMLWAELDGIVFKLDKAKRGPVLQAKRPYILRRLNADFQKPWFAGFKDGEKWVASALEDMTYLHVLERLVELMFVEKRNRWIDRDYATFFVDFALRSQERLGLEADRPLVSREMALTSPASAIAAVSASVPEVANTFLALEDVHFFLQLCRRPGMKPVPFVPALDDRFETWFKKDSLWQSEDLDAVVDGDAGRTLILHGPVAASKTNIVDEPVGDVLGGINDGIIESLISGSFFGDMERIPSTEYISAAFVPLSDTVTGNFDVKDLTIQQLRALLAGKPPSWRHALFTSETIARGRSLITNPLQQILDTVDADFIDITERGISIMASGSLAVEISRSGTEILVKTFTLVTGNSNAISLDMKFTYHPETPYALIHENSVDRNQQIYNMYRQLWLGEIPTTPESPPESSVFEGSFKIDRARVQAFNRAVGYDKAHRAEKVPLDFAIVASWKPICQALLQDPVQGDLLALVHLSNSYKMAREAQMPKFGDQIRTRASVTAITIDDSGKTVTVECKLCSAISGDEIMTVRSRFLFRGSYADFESAFEKSKDEKFEFALEGKNDLAVLVSKPWFKLHPETVLDGLEKDMLEFHLQAFTRFQSKSMFRSIEVTGTVYTRSEAGGFTSIATVCSNAANTSINTVSAYLSRRGKAISPELCRQSLKGNKSGPNVTVEIIIPACNKAYSLASGDVNPIHTSPMFASLVNLPGTITHGMYVSAAVRAALEKTIAAQHPERIRAYDVSFVGMVLPNDILVASFIHVAMQDGLKVVEIEVLNQSTGEKVLTGTTLIAQPPTTIVFTGQGSQEKGMGMDLYESSHVARDIWDRADAYFRAQFGLSILDIVRNNPKSIQVPFGGVKGRMLRNTYMEMAYEVENPTTGQLERRPLFPRVTPRSTSVTHSSPDGLLFATQFAQPTLTIMELAAFRDMQAQGVVDDSWSFAGHSLGEYAALAAITDFMPFERLLYLVFCRGMTMQFAVERDETGRSGFGMVAVDPGRVGKGFDEEALKALVAGIRDEAGFFVEIVNLNVRENQYVCAGDLCALELLQKVLDDVKMGKASSQAPFLSSIETLSALYADKAPSDITLIRGLATVPLSGVDVPFHSSFLRSRMEAFRRVLLENLERGRIRPERLCGKYIPNVTGRPFGISREDCEEIWRITQSQKIKDILNSWSTWERRITKERNIVLSI